MSSSHIFFSQNACVRNSLMQEYVSIVKTHYYSTTVSMFGDFQVLCLVFTHFQGIEMKLSTLGFKDFQLQVLSRTAGTLELFQKNFFFYSTLYLTSADFMQARTAHQFVCLSMTIITHNLMD